MKMKESIGSLKAYFIVVAILLLVQGIYTYTLSTVHPVLVAIIGLIYLAFAIAYFYIGFWLRKLLAHASNRINYVIYATVAFEILYLFLISLINVATMIAAIIRLVVALLLAWYLLKNVRRLTLEEKSKPDITGTQE